MSDPYQVLGVDRNADDDEIKKAYHDLARKYHPDKYRDSDLADLAEEKMKEINDAYDRIRKERRFGERAAAELRRNASLRRLRELLRWQLARLHRRGRRAVCGYTFVYKPEQTGRGASRAERNGCQPARSRVVLPYGLCAHTVRQLHRCRTLL